MNKFKYLMYNLVVKAAESWNSTKRTRRRNSYPKYQSIKRADLIITT